MAKRIAKKVLVIGWDAAEWKVIRPLIQEGKMPTLAKFLAESSWGNFATLDPPLSPMLWTSMATGKRPYKHGILGFIEPAPDGKGVQPSTSTSRTCKAIWNILTQKGFKSNVVSWWPSHPAEPINGVMVSNFFQQNKDSITKPWPMMEGTVYPERLKKEMQRLRIHPDELTQAHILPFVPNAAKIDQEKDKRLQGISKIIAETSTVQAAGTYLLEKEEWDFTGIYFDGIDHFSHAAMKFHPPKMDSVPQELFDMYKDVVSSGYRFHDMMLERQLQLAGEDTTVIIVSDHGFHPDHNRPVTLPIEPAGPALEHSPYGIFAIKGPCIKKDNQIYGAKILDLTPTILTLFGLPVGEDMDGVALTQCYKDPYVIEKIPSWDDVEGEDGSHDPDKKENKWASAEALQQLVDLGYIEAPDENVQKSVEDARIESQYYLSRAYINGGKYDEGVKILQEIYEKKPEEHRFAHKLAHAYISRRQFKSLKELISGLRKYFEHYDPTSIDEELKNFKPNEKLNDKEKEEAILKKKDYCARKKNQNERDKVYIDFLEALFYMSVNEPRKAMKLLKKIEEKASGSQDVFLQMGKICQIRQRWDDAEKNYIKALALDSTNAQGHHGLGVSYLRQNKYEDAIDELLTALDILYYLPNAHYHLGEALYKIGRLENAVEAFNVAITMTPGMTKAHRWLTHIYKEDLKMLDKAKIHQDFLDNNIKGEVVIVSGLPRSGTSMMMQMLHNGGMEVMVDQNRIADENNPKGYFEYEPVKRLANNKAWMKDANGKALKVIAQLITFLPEKFNYKIIFMNRNMNEVLTSQQIMLGKKGMVKANAFPVGLAEAFNNQIVKMNAWISSQPNINMMEVNYSDVITNPEETAENICSFLGEPLDIKKMASVVDSSLYRNKQKVTAK